MKTSEKARAVGINHVALEVGDLDEAIAFFDKIFALTWRGRNETMAFVELGDQYLALVEAAGETVDEKRHFGLVVDSVEKVRRRLEEHGVATVPGFGLNFRDPWGNRFQIFAYADVQFVKDPGVMQGMGLDDLEKAEETLRELADKGMAPTCASR